MNELISLFRKADEYRKAINGSRPMSDIELISLQNYFRVSLTYASNALEGNTLTLTETKILLEDGLTVGGKPVKDVSEAIGHSKAYDYMLKEAKAQPFNINEKIIKQLHYLFYVGIDSENAGVYRKIKVYISGTEYIPPSPKDVPARMKAFWVDMNGRKDLLHPIEYAARLHKGLVDIHPFVDGNGRTARLLMNLALVNAGYGIAVIPPILRGEYIDALKASQRAINPDDRPFIELIARCVIETQRDYCRLLGIPIHRVNQEVER